jgi:hypothetical protein
MHAKVFVLHVATALRFDAQCRAVGQRELPQTAQPAFLHVQGAAEHLGLAVFRSQIYDDTIHFQADGLPAQGIEHLGEVFRITVLPPANPCFVG